jgi:esterase/lipase
MVLWDPSIKLAEIVMKICKYDKHLNKYIFKSGSETLISKEMINQWENLDSRMVEKIRIPTKIICAGMGPLKKYWVKYADKIRVPHEFKIIENADHCFSNEGNLDTLYNETLSFLRKH